jgi:hypothetical protein
MKYMLMIYGNKAGWDSLTQNMIDEIGTDSQSGAERT